MREGNINPLKNVSCLTQRQMIKNSSTPALVPAVIGNWLCVHNNAFPTFFTNDLPQQPGLILLTAAFQQKKKKIKKSGKKEKIL